MSNESKSKTNTGCPIKKYPKFDQFHSKSANMGYFSVAKATLQLPKSTEDAVILKQGCGYIQNMWLYSKNVVYSKGCGYIAQNPYQI